MAGPQVLLPTTQQSLPVTELAVQQCHAVHNYRLISVSVQYWPFTGLAVQQRRTVHNCGPISASAHLPAELAIRWACSAAVTSCARWQAQKCPCPPPSRAFQSLGSQSSIAEYCTTLAGPLIPMLNTQQSLPVAELAVQLCRAVHNYRPVVSLPNTRHSLGLQCSSAAPCTLVGLLVLLPTTQQSLPVTELAVQLCHAVHNYRLISVSAQHWTFAGLAVQQCRAVDNGGPISASAHLPAELAIRWAYSTAVPSCAQWQAHKCLCPPPSRDYHSLGLQSSSAARGLISVSVTSQ